MIMIFVKSAVAYFLLKSKIDLKKIPVTTNNALALSYSNSIIYRNTHLKNFRIIFVVLIKNRSNNYYYVMNF